jgi:hypothetical protein
MHLRFVHACIMHRHALAIAFGFLLPFGGKQQRGCRGVPRARLHLLFAWLDRKHAAHHPPAAAPFLGMAKGGCDRAICVRKTRYLCPFYHPTNGKKSPVFLVIGRQV